MIISIFKFLADYYGITLDAGGYCSHSVAKKNFKFLKGCPYNYADHNPELVNCGKIIYVSDSVGKIVPYVAPDILKTSKSICNYTKKELDKSNDSLSEISELPTHILGELLSKYKKYPSIYRLIKGELINRGIYENKIYKLRKEKLKIEESGENDKYQRRRKIKCKKP